jgi:hypothetical protein
MVKGALRMLIPSAEIVRCVTRRSNVTIQVQDIETRATKTEPGERLRIRALPAFSLIAFRINASISSGLPR